jgi:hypothetical protein
MPGMPGILLFKLDACPLKHIAEVPHFIPELPL